MDCLQPYICIFISKRNQPLNATHLSKPTSVQSVEYTCLLQEPPEEAVNHFPTNCKQINFEAGDYKYIQYLRGWNEHFSRWVLKGAQLLQTLFHTRHLYIKSGKVEVWTNRLDGWMLLAALVSRSVLCMLTYCQALQGHCWCYYHVCAETVFYNWIFILNKMTYRNLSLKAAVWHSVRLTEICIYSEALLMLHCNQQFLHLICTRIQFNTFIFRRDH